MPPREPSAVRPYACKLLGFPALSNGNSPPQLTALSTIYPWYSLPNVDGLVTLATKAICGIGYQ